LELCGKGEALTVKNQFKVPGSRFKGFVQNPED
jgi:hypothetical protein